MKVLNFPISSKEKPDARRPAMEPTLRISRTKIELFINCPRCFYNDCKLGIKRPPSFPYTLNNAVDSLLRKEFDSYREKHTPHPLMVAAGIEAVPFSHPDLKKWRDLFQGGIKFKHTESNLLVSGLVDDIWVNRNGELLVVDYKATAKKEEVTLDAEWQNSYKRQVEVYQWLLRKNDFNVSNTSYFVYCNADLSLDSFNAKLEFRIKILSHQGDDRWIEGTLSDIRQCLNARKAPNPSAGCSHCVYRSARQGSQG